jgi:transcriptional regulator with XRE-family HTH domain
MKDDLEFENTYHVTTVSSVMVHVSQREKEIRKRQGLTQQELSQRAGVSLASLRRFEQTGMIEWESLVKIANVLGYLDELDKLLSQKTYTSIEEVIRDNESKKA